MVLLLATWAGCLFAPDVYRQRLEELDDDDADGWSEDAGDCDDLDPNRYPGNAELCDRADNDCDERVDEEVTSVFTYSDEDGDGFGDLDSPLYGCESGGVADSTDCDDTSPEIHPEAAELCNGSDDDCDGDDDEDASDASEGYLDRDGDGYGDLSSPWRGCDPTGVVEDSGDCDDGNAWVYPGAPERLDGVVNNCTAPDPLDEVTTASADLLLTGGGDFGSAVSAFRDLTADGVSDLVVGHDTHVEMFIGPLSSGAAPAARLTVSEWSGGLLAGGDADGDGNDDLILGTAGGVALVDANARGDVRAAATLNGPSFPVWWDGSLLVAGGSAGARWWSSPVRDADGTTVEGGAATSAVRVDLDGDGVSSLVIGGPQAVYVVFADTTSLGDADWVVRDDEPGSEFGAVLAAPGDLNGDGYADLAVGAAGADGTGTDDGRVYLFVEESSSAAQAEGYVVGRSADARGGALILTPGDTDGDGADDIWVAGPGEASDGTGPVATLALYQGPIVGRTEARARSGFILGDQGCALGSAGAVGSVDGSGLLPLSIGAPGAGAAYVFLTELR